jgi:dihydrodipicolinate synthase/N-acetylneuraminate lyase
MKEIIRRNVAGIWSAMPTPFTEDLELDSESVSRLVEHHVRLGIKGLFLSSVFGEGQLMSDSMKMDLAAEVVKSNQDHMLLSMMIEDNPAKLMIDNIKCIKEIGIDIAVIGFPFTPIDIEEKYLMELYFSVLEKSPLPIALCHVNRVASAFLLRKILLHPKVILVKNFSSDPGITARILNSAKGRENELFILGANEANCMPSVSRDYDGFVLNSACFVGFIANAIYEFAQAERITDARETQDYMNSILIEIFGLDLDNYLIGQKQMMVELEIFNTAKTLLDCEISDECIKAIKRIAQEEKEFLLPEIKPQSEE